MTERTADGVTLAILAIAFGMKAGEMVRRTREWNGLGRSLAVMAGSFAGLWTWALIAMFWSAVRSPWIVWFWRVELTIVAVWVIYELRTVPLARIESEEAAE